MKTFLSLCALLLLGSCYYISEIERAHDTTESLTESRLGQVEIITKIATDKYGSNLPLAETRQVESARFDEEPAKPKFTYEVENANWKIGEPAEIKLYKQDMPDEASIVIALKHPKSENYGGTIGPLMLQPRPFAGSGEELFIWDGSNVGCAKEGNTSWCDDLKMGQYILEITVYSRANFSILGQSDRSEKKVLFQESTLISLY